MNTPLRGLWIGLLCAPLAACGGAPTLPATAPRASSPDAAADPAIPLEGPLPPDALRCGVDDGPVPIGELPRKQDLRLAILGSPLALIAMPEPIPIRAMLPTVALRPRADGLSLPNVALSALFQPCAEQAEPSDAGEISLSVAFGANGAPRTSRPIATGKGAGPTPFARCLAERACRFPVSPTLAGKVFTASVGITLSPPEFRGQVEASVSFVPLSQSAIAQRPSKPVQSRMDTLQKLLRAAGSVCAKRVPPEGGVFFEGSMLLEGGKAKTFAFQPLLGHGEVLRICIETELAAGLATLEPARKLGASLNLSVTLVAEPETPPPPGSVE